MSSSAVRFLEYLQNLDEQQLSTFIREVVLYTQYRASARYGWSGEDGIPRGFQAKDLVFESIQDLCCGQRTWDQERFPDLLSVLKRIIDSKLSNLKTSSEYELEYQPLSEQTINEFINKQPDPDLWSPEEMSFPTSMPRQFS